MNDVCRKITDRLATEGPRALRDDEAAQVHLTECDDCFALLQSISALEDGLHAMPAIDAPDAAVASLLARSELTRPAASAGEPRPGRRRAARGTWLRPRPLVWSSVAAGFMLVAIALGLRLRVPAPATEPFAVVVESAPRGESRPDEKNKGRSNVDARTSTETFADDRPAPDRVQSRQSELELELKQGYRQAPETARRVDDPAATEEPNARGRAVRESQSVVGGLGGGKDDAGTSTSNVNSIEELERITSGAGLESADRAFDELREIDAGDRDGTAEPQDKRIVVKKYVPPPAPQPQAAAGAAERAAGDDAPRAPVKNEPVLAGVAGVAPPRLIESSRVDPEYPEAARRSRVAARVILQVIVDEQGAVTHAEVLDCSRPEMGFESAAIEAVRKWRYQPATRDGVPVDVFLTVGVDFDPAADSDRSAISTDPSSLLARAFLDDRARVDDLRFVEASGYWSNTYVPGDPTTRLLQARLAGAERSAGGAWSPSRPAPHDRARRIGQPFDRPLDSALAVYLHADRRGLSEPGRMLVQVGLAGTPRHGGRRPAMNLALVLDLRGAIPPDVAIGIRSLLEAFNRARQPGDRFSVYVAGRPGGCVVAPREFRHGFLTVTLDRLIASRPEGDPASVAERLAEAIRGVARADDPSAPLGSSAVVLITGRSLEAEAATLAGLAHQGAVAGIPLSVVGVGSAVDPAEIDVVTLAGQGRRRWLAEPTGAAALVDRELAAVSRVIARAVRLRIRLAPGVKLVDVLGSERLDARRAQRVRDAEASIDLRLSRNLGIEADRGEDEEGIQIVIPSFYAGDSHVVLLDVVAPGPGAIADVTVRYKDLVHLENGVARARLDRGRDVRPAGALERNVLKNLLALRQSAALDAAGRALKSGDAQRAIELLDGFAGLLAGLRHHLAGLDNDPEIAADIALLDEYRALVARGFDGRPDRRDYLADSLRFAARLKTSSRPLETRS